MCNVDESKVGSIVAKAAEKLHDTSTCTFSQGFVFKVCGREEYFKK